MDLNTVWFILVGVLLTGYGVLDGFDIGAGILHLFVKGDDNRRVIMNSIGPVWDGNEVWLITGGGALFAAFPMVYATVFSGFYLALMLLLFALIFRAVSLEFRSRHADEKWRGIWDIAFSVSSIVAGLLYGVALGNVMRGVPIDSSHEFAGTFLGLLNPYALLTGLAGLALFALHGGTYLLLKTEGDLHYKIKELTVKSFWVFLVLLLLSAAATFAFVPRMTGFLSGLPVLWILPLLTLAALYNVRRSILSDSDRAAFLSTSAVMVLLLAMFGIGMYPELLHSYPDVGNGLDIYNAASSQLTLKVMLIIALLGMPLVIAYNVFIYRVFRGKVSASQEEGY